MVKKILILLLVILLISNFSLAATPELINQNEGKEICDYLIKETTEYLKYEIPSFLPYKNEVMNAYTKSGQLVGHLELENRKVKSYNCEEAINPTYNITIENKQTITDILESNSSLKEFDNKLNNKEIKIRGTTVSKELKGFFTKISLKIVNLFV